ncbi:MAG: RNA polymerase sigma factor [Clostridiales bacterium]|nr:RNA polymerase sigma factor [Clostridiales bacterium]
MPQQTADREACAEAFQRIYEETFADMRRYVAFKCADVSYIPDILQETYLAFYRLMLRGGPDCARNGRAVLYKIARRKVYAYYTLREAAKRLLPLSRTRGEQEEEPSPERFFEEAGVEEQALNKAESERLWRVVSSYSADVRKIFYLFFYEGMSHAEIAAALGCGLSNVKNKLYRTLSQIREREMRDEHR